MLWKPEGGQHIRGDGGFHRRHCLLDASLISHSSSPVEVSDSRPVSRQPAQLLHPGTDAPQNVHTTQADANLDPPEILILSSQASNYREVGKVTGDGLIKGHAYAITDTDKASMTQTLMAAADATSSFPSAFLSLLL